jgi:hypothetical protein
MPGTERGAGFIESYFLMWKTQKQDNVLDLLTLQVIFGIVESCADFE